MTLKRKLSGGLLAFIGFMLSPLSWWNDAFVNIPIALVLAWAVAAIYHPAFEPALVAGYWLTNVAGFVLMHKGAQQMLREKKAYSRRELFKDAAISLAYTAVILALLRLRVLQPLTDYFGGK